MYKFSIKDCFKFIVGFVGMISLGFLFLIGVGFYESEISGSEYVSTVESQL